MQLEIAEVNLQARSCKILLSFSSVLASFTMEHWQFLIQKQGDRSWHTLESPNIEILEGRYRVLARSNLPNTDVEVRVIHSSTQELPPKRRVQKRSRRTNSEGLMAVIPFTYLKAGIWELRCSGDLMADILGKSWQYGIRLQVLPWQAQGVARTEVTGEDVDSTFYYYPVITKNNSAIAKELIDQEEEAAINQPISPVWIKGETAEQILQNLIDLALPTPELLLGDEKVDNSPAVQAPPPLLLSLDRETYITRWGHLLTIHGRVESQENAKTPSLESLYALELRIELRSPFGSQILTQVRQALADKLLPFTIRSSIDIPADCESKLILADISLYGAITDVSEVILLANQSFTITADVAELLAVTTAVKPEPLDDTSASSLSTVEPPITIDLELFNLVKTPQTNQSQAIQLSPNQPLPPQIDLISLKKSVDLRAPQLPKLPEPQVDAVSEELPEADSQLQETDATDVVVETLPQNEPQEQDDNIISITPAPINLAQLVIKNSRVSMPGSTFRYLKKLPALPSNKEEVTINTLDTLDFQAVKDSPQENTPELVVDDEQFQDDTAIALAPPNLELIDESVLELPLEPNLELATTDNLYSSPLIRQWMQTQGYSVPEFIDNQPDTDNITDDYQQTFDNQLDTDNITDDYQQTFDNQPDIPLSAENSDVDVNLLLDFDTETDEVNTDTFVAEEINTQEYEDVEDISTESSALVLQVPELLPSEPIKTPQTWLSQEFVVDDTYSEVEVDVTKIYSSQDNKQPISDLSSPPPMNGAFIESLPIPQLYVPDGELIAGKSLRVRVELPEVSPQVVVKLWVEDCQTRWLLDGPHLLKDLLPNTLGGSEAMTQLNVPFGCLEIRIEAIAIDMVTQQESHKVTIVRTVIPPDLPNLQLDELLGI